MLCGAGLKLVPTFLLTLVLVLCSFTRSMFGGDLAIVANSASAGGVLPGETLENDNNDGSITVSPSLLHSFPFYHSCFASGSNCPVTTERILGKDNVKFYVFDRALLI